MAVLAEQYSVAKSLERLHQSKTFRWRSGGTKVRIGHGANVTKISKLPFTVSEWQWPVFLYLYPADNLVAEAPYMPG